MTRTPQQYDVRLVRPAEEAYLKFLERAKGPLAKGDHGNVHVKTLRMIDELLDKTIPHDPFNPERALSGHLKSIYRVKKARLRICYIGSSDRGIIDVLLISERLRKSGDKNDPYAILSKLMASGKLDIVFEAIGLRPPSARASIVDREFSWIQ